MPISREFPPGKALPTQFILSEYVLFREELTAQLLMKDKVCRCVSINTFPNRPHPYCNYTVGKSQGCAVQSCLLNSNSVPYFELKE